MPAIAVDSMLRAGLEFYYAHYARALRLARTSTDPALAGHLIVRLLDWNGQIRLDPTSPAIAERPEAPRGADGMYVLPANYRFCIQIASSYEQPLAAVALNCGAAGQVEYLGDTTVRRDDRQILWQKGKVGNPFRATSNFSRVATDRLVVVATNPPQYEPEGSGRADDSKGGERLSDSRW